jgi:hypothetical protein
MKQILRLLILLSIITCSISLLAMEEKRFKPKSLVFTTAFNIAKNKLDYSKAPTEVQEKIRSIEEVLAADYSENQKKELYNVINDPSYQINRDLLESILDKADTEKHAYVFTALKSQEFYQDIVDKLLFTSMARNNIQFDFSFLLRMGANPNARDHNQKTPLMIAAKENDWLNIIKLIRYGADKSLKCNRGLTALEIAEKYGRAQAVEELKQFHN